MRDKIQILNYYIDSSLPDLKAKNRRNFVFNTINPHSYAIAKKDLKFQNALLQSDSLLPDGVGIVWAARILGNQRLRRFTGSDLHIELLNYLNQIGGRVFYLGSSDSTLEKIQQKLRGEYPRIQMDFYSPPFKNEFTQEDNDEILRRIWLSSPHVVFVGMTAPKQEKWVFENHEQIDVQYIASIGAVFDFYSGNIKRSGKFWQILGLEWLPRLIQEPKRLWKRTFVSLPIFLFDVFLKRISVK